MVDADANLVHEDPVESSAESGSVKEAFKLAWRCWPYYRPQAKHLATFVLINSVLGAFALGAAVIGTDLIENKIILGEKLEPLQATMLLLDEDFVSSAGAENGQLGLEQRKVVRERVIVLAGVLAVLLLGISVCVWYYMTWIFQRVNQDLRVEMLSRVEHLSLRYHSDSKTGDAIYRIYQDSATIVNVLLYLVISPLRVVAWATFGIIVLLLFSPVLGFLLVAAAVPTIMLMRFYIPKIRVAATLSREYNSDLTSRIQETLAAIRVVKASGAETRLMERFQSDSQKALDAAFDMRKYIAYLTVSVAVVGLSFVFIADYFMATDYLRGDVAIKGGLTSCLKTAHTAETFQMNYEVHHGGNSLNNVANLHLIMAVKNCEYFEVLLPDEVQKHGLVKDIEVDKNGLVHAHQGPGLGAEIDFDLIEHNKVADL